MAVSIGLELTLTAAPSRASSLKSLGGRSKVMSMSPLSSSARRLPALGTSRCTMRRSLGKGPLFQSSLRT